MKSSHMALSACVLAAAAMAPPAAIADEFQIFSNLRTGGLFSSDLNPALPGIEHLNINFSDCVLSAPDVDGKITARQSVSISASSADGTATVFRTALPTYSTTFKFPDPRLAAHHCGAPGEGNYHTSYESLDPALNTNVRTLGCPAPGGHPQYGQPFTFDPEQLSFCGEFPRAYVGAGIATKNATRVLLVGVGVKGVLERPTFADVSKFTISAYNMDGTRRWTKTIPSNSGGKRLFADWAAVGDFLDDDNNEEIRIVYAGTSFVHVFYDVLTGAVTRTVTVVR